MKKHLLLATAIFLNVSVYAQFTGGGETQTQNNETQSEKKVVKKQKNDYSHFYISSSFLKPLSTNLKLSPNAERTYLNGDRLGVLSGFSFQLGIIKNNKFEFKNVIDKVKFGYNIRILNSGSMFGDNYTTSTEYSTSIWTLNFGAGPNVGIYLSDKLVLNSSLLLLPGFSSINAAGIFYGNPTGRNNFVSHFRKALVFDFKAASFTFGIEFSSGKLKFEEISIAQYDETQQEYVYSTITEKKNKSGRIDIKFGLMF